MTLDDLKSMIAAHDKYYMMSDSAGVYRRGQAEKDAIERAAKELGLDAAALAKLME